MPNNREAEADGVADKFDRFTDRVGKKPLQAERALPRRRRRDRDAACVGGSTIAADTGRATPGRLFQIADKGVLKRGDAARLTRFGRRIGRQHPAGIHQRNAVAALGLVHEMGGDEDRHALIARQLDQQLPEAVARQGVDARGRLVEDEHLRFVDHGDRERQALADAERQIRRALVEIIVEAEALDQLGDARLRLAAPADGKAARAMRGSAGR